jgi:hypothetical protein
VWEFYHYRRELVLTKEPNKVWHELNKLFPFFFKLAGCMLQFISKCETASMNVWHISVAKHWITRPFVNIINILFLLP